MLSVRLAESVLRAGMIEAPGRRVSAKEMVCRIEPEQLSLAVGQRTAGLSRVWLELTIAEGGGVPRPGEH